MTAFGSAPSRFPDDDGPRPGSAARLSPLRELQLLESSQAGDPDALRELLVSYQHRVYAVCLRMVRNPETARDLTQDTLVKLIEGLGSYTGRAKLSTWIIRIAMNCCLSHLRKQKLRIHKSLDDAVGLAGMPRSGTITDPREPGPGTRVQRDEDQDLLLRALDGLDPEMRAILVLRDMQGLEYQQIGDVLDAPVGTVKSRLFRARSALRDAIERIGGREFDASGPDH